MVEGPGLETITVNDAAGLRRWFEKNHSLMQTVECLRICIHAGRTVDEAIGLTREMDTNYIFRQQLGEWYERVCEGSDIAESARQCGLGESLSWAFDTKVNQGNTPEVLSMLEEVYRKAYNYRGIMLRNICWPVVMLAAAIVVGMVVYALFLPMVEMINHVMSSILT